MTVRVVEVAVVADRAVLIGDIGGGEEPHVGTLLSAPDARWRVVGTGFVPPDAWAQGRRAWTIERVAGEREPIAGEELVAH